MILTQKYHSVTEIDPEFIPGLERLLTEYAPSFEWIKNFEKSAPESTHFTYYLYFGDRNNEPVGFAQIAINPCIEERPWYRKFLTPSLKKQLTWTTPTSSSEGIIIDPFYAKRAIEKTKTIIRDQFERSEIAGQSLVFSKAYNDLQEIQGVDCSSINSHKKIANTLVKNGNCYEHYLEQQAESLRKAIQQDWKKLYTTLAIDIGDFTSFKAIFEYRSNGPQLYKNLKKDKSILPYLSEQTSFVTFEKEQEIQAILFLLKGQGNHYFFDWKIFNSNITASMMIQLAILKFYELNHATHLHPLTGNDFSLLHEVGFSGKSLFEVQLNRTRHKVSA